MWVLKGNFSSFQSQNILDLLDVVPPAGTSANPAPPPSGGANDLLDLLGDVATISNPGTVQAFEYIVVGCVKYELVTIKLFWNFL